MADGAASSQGRDNSRVTSALITGAFGFLGTVATLLAMRYGAPTPQPAAQLSGTATDAGQPSPAAVPKVSRGQATSLPQVQASSPRPAPNLLLNFAAFQERLATPNISPEERERIVRPLRDRTVVWKGYVDEITPMDSPTGESAVTVSLVESRERTNQSMFKTPAHFRFGPEALEAVAALAPGDLVTLSGTLRDHSFVATNVSGAHVQTVNGRLAVRAAAAPARDSAR